MFTIGDEYRAGRRFPVVRSFLIVLNVAVFLFELSSGDAFIDKWAFVPVRFNSEPMANAATVISAMFMHGGWLHLGGNMLYLWIFGDNVEDRLGPVRFTIFYF